MKNMLFKRKYLIFSLAVLVLGLFLSLSSIHHVNAQENGINISPSTYDFGDIDQGGGIVSTEVVVENKSSIAIDINRLSTSCGCTTALMSTDTLEPGEKRVMKISFDPMVHPDFRGELTRVVYLQTSDPYNPEIEINITGVVVSSDNNAQINDNSVESKKGIQSERKMIVFFNEACSDCGILIKETYPQFFGEYGYEVIQKDYVNERENRKFLNEYNTNWKIPFELQSHIEAFIDDRLVFGGHVPVGIMIYLMENPDSYDRLLVYQDKMHGEETDYKVWDFEGEVKTYPIDEPITTYLSELNEGKIGANLSDTNKFWGMFGLVTTSAFLDGLNPCAFAVLLFFIAFLFSIKRTKRSIWKTGLVYVFGIFLAYLLIGLGIAQAIIISGAPHLMAYVGAYLVIGLGIIQLLGVIFPSFPIKLRIPVNSRATAEKWLYKATTPAVFIGGFVVGLCTFPCSGGIYVAIIGMLVSTQTYMKGVWWMLWYNLVFISPLLILLVLAGNPKTTGKLQEWERKESKNAKVLIGVTMIALGLIILLFFV
ncbi:MAG: DUF1573 domain-containing protein [bacterium]|nr:DUF1573 domain-containing protein [bacterium]